MDGVLVDELRGAGDARRGYSGSGVPRFECTGGQETVGRLLRSAIGKPGRVDARGNALEVSEYHLNPAMAGQATMVEALPVGGTSRSDAPQLAVLPPPDPAHVHDHGPVPVTAEGVPAVHSSIVGADESDRLLDEPQRPGMGDAVPVIYLAAKFELVNPVGSPDTDTVCTVPSVAGVGCTVFVAAKYAM